MAGSKRSRKAKEQELQIRKEQERITDEHVEIARAYEQGHLTQAEYREMLLDMDYGEITRLWRVKHLRCANPESLSEQQIMDVAIRAHGVIVVMCRILGLDRWEVTKLIKKYPRVKRTIAEERENIVDMAECRLFEAANMGQEWAIKMILYCQGKYRGWTKEMSASDNKGRILAALDHLTGEMDEEELHEYDIEAGFVEEE